MTTALLDKQAARARGQAPLAITDCDIHPLLRSFSDLNPFLAQRWQEHFKTYGVAMRHGHQKGPAYPKGQPGAHRLDAWPENGGPPGSDLELMRRQYLEPHNVELGILNPITPAAGAVQNLAAGAAIASAMNEWQVAHFTSREPRLRASVLVSYEDGPAAAAEIERRAGNPAFIQVLLMSRTAEPLGRRKYWPIYAAAEAAGLPVAVHAFGYGGNPLTGTGWPSFYIEEMAGHAQNCAALLTSMVIEGVFEQFPKLKMVLVESGFGWVPALGWRLDKLWRRLGSEIAHIKRPPSEIIRERVWFTTQPMEEPERRRHFNDIVGWIGLDRLLFASDYPHWDFDDPDKSLSVRLDDAQRRMLFRDNARAVYGF